MFHISGGVLSSFFGGGGTMKLTFFLLGILGRKSDSLQTEVHVALVQKQHVIVGRSPRVQFAWYELE